MNANRLDLKRENLKSFSQFKLNGRRGYKCFSTHTARNRPGFKILRKKNTKQIKNKKTPRTMEIRIAISVILMHRIQHILYHT